MKVWMAVLAISGLVTVQANIFDQISAIANNVEDAYSTGSSVQLSDASSEANDLVDNVKDAIEERISEIDIQGSLSNLLQQYNIDDSSISSVASTYEGLDPATQVDVIGSILQIPLQGANNLLSSSRKLLRARA